MSGYTYVQNNNVIFRQEEDEAIIFNPDNSDIVTVNSTGCLIWSMCDGRHSKEEIIQKIMDEFEVSPEAARKDLDTFIADLGKRDFLEKIK